MINPPSESLHIKVGIGSRVRVRVWLSNFLSSSSRGIWGMINPPSESLHMTHGDR